MMEPCSHRFTAAEGGARLAATAAAGNTLLTECGAFIATRLLHEEAYNIRGLLSAGRQRSIYIGRAANVRPDAYELSVLTDLKVTQAISVADVVDWSQELETKEVVVCTSEVFRHILDRGLLLMSQVNVLVIDSCHLIYQDANLQHIMRVYKQTDERTRPRILAITYPLFSSPKTTDKTNKTTDKTNKTTDETDKTPDEIEQTIDSENALALLNETSHFVPDKSIDNKKIETKRKKEFGVNDNLDDFEMYEKLEYTIDELEKELCCRMDLAEDIDGCKRISGPTTKPKEVLIEYESRPPQEELSREYTRLETYMRESVAEVIDFLEDHRHDPTEIYGDELYDEFKNIPDPTVEPRQVFKEFLYILDQLGPYAADKAAFSLLVKLEKLKIKVPYERHFLLLRLCTTTLVKIRCYTAEIFEKIDSDWEKIQKFSTPKILRLVEILEKFTPPDLKASIENNTFKFQSRNDNDDNENNDVHKNSENNDGIKDSENNDVNKNENGNNDSNKSDSNIGATKIMLRTIENCDFTSLGNKIEDRINVMEGNLKDLDTADVSEEKNPEINKNPLAAMKNPTPEAKPAFTRRGGRPRVRRPPRAARAALLTNPDALCGVVYIHEPVVARTLFMVIVDITRCRPAVSYINSQYCCVEPVELSESQQQGRRHEEVLKKFRMHECNLLLTTSALEEGIDLPRCNLVLRWDEPSSYRSYVLCRARCRAARSGAGVLGAATRSRQLLHRLATYKELDQIITRKCGCGVQNEPSPEEESHADAFNALIKPYSPSDSPPQCQCDRKITNFTNSMKRTISDSENEHIDSEFVEETNSGNNDKSCSGNNDKTHSGNNETYSGNNDKSCIEKNDKTHSGNNVKSQSGSNDEIHSVSNDSDQIKSDNNDIEINLSVNNDSDINISECDAKYNNESVDSNKCACAKNNINSDNVASVDLNSAIALINRYCAKLPSDTFTRLAPQWWVERVRIPGAARDDYVCTLRMPLNCPVKYNIVGHPMPTRVLARRLAALQACRILHKSGELDNQLMPIGKENFKAMELESTQPILEAASDNDAARPGTTKRRQYYYKRTAWAFTDCQPVVDTSDTELEKPSTDSEKPGSDSEKLRSDSEKTRSDSEKPRSDSENPRSDSEKPNYTCSITSGCTDRGMPDGTDSSKPDCTDSVTSIGSDPELLRTDSKTPSYTKNLKNTESISNCIDSINAGVTESEATCNKSESTSINELEIPGIAELETGINKPGETGNTDSSTGKKETKVNEEPKGKSDCGKDTHSDKKNTGCKRNMLYAIESALWCALPERYNTRGRRLHAPQHANQALAILMARDEPTNLQIPAFPVYTRSGEVRVSVEHVPDADVRMSPRRGRLVRRFMRFVFTEVLRVRRRGMQLQNEPTRRNNYYIVPTIKSVKEDGSQKIDIDWPFLEQIYSHTEVQKLSGDKPLLWYLDEEELGSERDGNTGDGDMSAPLKNPLLKDGEVFVFDAERYREAVVTPWYRNQDQPQFFLVAEICWKLTPDSAFPSATHDTFRSYYRAKYKVELTQPNQPLLDVDHTSARLNLLTPRYVNRKGVALPVSSERTRRAKRDRLDQKQILVPELCTVHPFAAPLWFATVALPCVLYRINALLIADEIRRAVAIDVGLGIPKIDDVTMPGFQWPPLDFGWCLAEVLSADEKTVLKKDDDSDNDASQIDDEIRSLEAFKAAENGEDGSEPKEKTVNDILQEEHEKLNREDAESGFEIGTWSNEMASSIPDEVDYDELLEPLPPNLTFCTSANGGVNWCDSVQKPKPQNEYNSPRAYTMADSDCSYMSSDFDSDDSELECSGTDTDAESGFGSNKGVSASLGVRIEYKTAHEAEAVDLESGVKGPPSPAREPCEEARAAAELVALLRGACADTRYIEKFRASVEEHKNTIIKNSQFVAKNAAICEMLPEPRDNNLAHKNPIDYKEIFPRHDEINLRNGQISLESIEKNKRVLLNELKNSLTDNEISKLNCFYMKDINIDDPNYVNEKIANVGFDCKEKYVNKVLNYEREYRPYYEEDTGQNGKPFDFDYQPDLEGHPGPSPSVILQALTMSNANDGINLERLETIGDSFLKFAITAYLYCAHPTVHEGKLSHMRSKQVSNLNLYRLGRAARLGSRMIASKFEPHDNWLPPCHRAPPSPQQLHDPAVAQNAKKRQESTGCYIPYNLITQHSIPDKSIADCVEALIGAYLLWCGPRGALLFMAWLGIGVLPAHLAMVPAECLGRGRSPGESPRAGGQPPGARRPCRDAQGNCYQVVYGALAAPPSPLLRHVADPHGELERMLSGYEALEETLQYRFKDRSLLLQALTHASHHRNTLTDCYQRLEFLGDAILDYLITRHLFEDARRHSPGALTDLRSALVNNTIFATLAVRHGFHKYFRHMSPGLNEVLLKYVRIQEENGHSISEEHYLIQEDELEQAEDVEVPKALGDLFESIAGAIFLDSGMSLGAVWRSYERLMGAELEAFSAAAPKSPVRELLEAEPDTAKFGKPERLADGRRVRVCVEVFGRGTFKGIGRNYRIAKGTAARCALRHLKKHHR